jgi:hypothetical protein
MGEASERRGGFDSPAFGCPDFGKIIASARRSDVGLQFFKRVNLIPGLRVNLSRSGPSPSVGHRGAWFTFGPRGKRMTVGGLGTGLYYTERVPPAAAPTPGTGWRSWGS